MNKPTPQRQPKPQSSFNDDDVYVYNLDTAVIVQHIRCSRDLQCLRVLSAPPAGCHAERGQAAKYRGLKEVVPC